jgi:hypothetical protein
LNLVRKGNAGGIDAAYLLYAIIVTWITEPGAKAEAGKI